MNVAEPLVPGQPFLEHPRVVQIRRSLRLVWGFMLFSMAWVCYVIYHGVGARPGMEWLGAVALGLAFFSLIFPDWLTRRLNAGPAQDPLGTLLASLLVNFILRFTMTEGALILFLFAYPSAPAMAMAAYGAACGVMLFHFPSDGRVLLIASR